MSLNSIIRRKELDAALEGLGVPSQYRGPVADAVNKYLLEGFLMNPVKAGWKTSEFWLTLLTAASTAVGALAGHIPPTVATIAGSVISAGYAIARGFAKQGTASTTGQ